MQIGVFISLVLLAFSAESEVIENGITSVIANGENVDEPATFYAYLEIAHNGNVHFGGAVLIGPRAAITVAQNVNGFSAWRIGLDGIRIKELTWHTVSRAIIHDGYDPSRLRNNIAVLELDEPVATTIHRIPPSQVNFPIRDTIGEVVGFGLGHSGAVQPEVLQTITLRVLTPAECAIFYPYLAEDISLNKIFCAMNHDQHANICPGDQGGPIHSRVLRYTFGLASVIRTEDCNSPDSSPAAFVQLTAYADWLTPYRNLV